MGEMSSMVSRSPPFSVSTSHLNDFFWMSIRFGTSSGFSSRANVRRMRGASREAKTATPGDGGGTDGGGGPARSGARELGRTHKGATVQDSTGGRGPL